MKTLAPGFRELGRILRRSVLRGRLWRERRALASAETALGLLGWQQADYDTEAQAHVNQLTDCERAQAALANESAAHALEIERLAGQRAQEQAKWEQRRAAMLARTQPAVATAEEIEALATARRKEGKAIEARLPVLDREAHAAEQQYRAVVVAGVTLESQRELDRLRKVILAIPREIAEWRARLDESREEVAALEALLGLLRVARMEFEKGDAVLAGEMAVHLRAKRKIEKEIAALEKAKSDPYRAIGRVLADHRIAPLNQPETLSAVLDRRKFLTATEAALAALCAASASEERAAVWQAWALGGGALVVVVVVMLVAAC